MTLQQHERQTYETMWALPAYAERSPGELYLPIFLDMVGHLVLPKEAKWPDAAWTPCDYSVLDAGCGSGKGSLALRAAGFRVTLCDLTPAGLVDEVKALPFIESCLWDDLRPKIAVHDFVFCADVLEHIPTPFTMLVVSRLLEVARKGVFLSISLMPDEFGVWVGKPLHQTVQTFPSWRDQLSALGTVKESRDLLHCGIFLVVPR